jgi:hypothetical protein
LKEENVFIRTCEIITHYFLVDVYVQGNDYKCDNSVTCCCFPRYGDFVMGRPCHRSSGQSLASTAGARVRARIWTSGIVVDKVALVHIFSEYFDFTANSHSAKFSILTIARGRYNRPEVADVASGRSSDSALHYAN